MELTEAELLCVLVLVLLADGCGDREGAEDAEASCGRWVDGEWMGGSLLLRGESERAVSGTCGVPTGSGAALVAAAVAGPLLGSAAVV